VGILFELEKCFNFSKGGNLISKRNIFFAIIARLIFFFDICAKLAYESVNIGF